VAVAVIGRLLVGVLQNLVGFVGFLELCFGLRVVGVAVGVQFLGLLAIAFLDLLGGRAFRDSEHIVEIAFCHVNSVPL